MLDDGAIVERWISNANVFENASGIGERDALVCFDSADELRVEATAREQRRAIITVTIALPEEEKILLHEIENDQSNDFAHVHAADHFLEARTRPRDLSVAVRTLIYICLPGLTDDKSTSSSYFVRM